MTALAPSTRPTRVDTADARAYAAALDAGSVRGHASAGTIRDLAADLDATREELARALATAALWRDDLRRQAATAPVIADSDDVPEFLRSRQNGGTR